MEWQNEEIQKRLRMQDEKDKKFNLTREKFALMEKETHDFIDKLIESNNKLDPVIRVANINNVYNWKVKVHTKNLCNDEPIQIRFDIRDNCLYLVIRKEIPYFWNPKYIKRLDYLHYKISEPTVNKFIDIILKNMCKGCALFDNLPGYTMTIKGRINYEEIAKRDYFFT